MQRGHRFVFFERDIPYYAPHRDLYAIPGGELHIYTDWPSILPRATEQLAAADVAIVTSYCPDGAAAAELLLESPARLRAFYEAGALPLWRSLLPWITWPAVPIVLYIWYTVAAARAAARRPSAPSG